MKPGVAKQHRPVQNIYMATRVKLNRVLHCDELLSIHHRDSMNELQHLLDFH